MANPMSGMQPWPNHKPSLLKQSGTHQAHRTSPRKQCRLAGFTLTELLVTIVIIGALLAITLPALRSVRASAQQAASLSHLKQNADRFYVHATERDVFPVAPANDDPYGPLLQINGDPPNLYVFLTFPQGGGNAFYYFSNESFWNMYLVSLGDEPATNSWYSPSLDPPEPTGDPTWWVVRAHYLMSHAFMAGPEYFRDPADRDRTMWRAIRPEEVAYPAVKALLVETSSGVKARYPGTPIAEAPTPIAFADGHVETRRLADAVAPAPNLPTQFAAKPLIETYNGILGRDF